MIYVKSILGGLTALLLSFVLFMVWLIRLAPKGGTAGFNPAHILVPRVLLVESAIFVAGFGVVWMLLRHK